MSGLSLTWSELVLIREAIKSHIRLTKLSQGDKDNYLTRVLKDYENLLEKVIKAVNQ